MGKKRVFLTGATGAMGLATLKELLKGDGLEIVLLALDTKKDRRVLATYEAREGLEIRWGNLKVYDDVLPCLRGAEIVLHIGALVSPEADYRPGETMAVNYGSTVNIIRAIGELDQRDFTRLVFIGTVAETGDRMPPLHWGRVGDPIKPSVFDYYAVSKIAAERAVVESGLKYWVSLRQTGMLSEKMGSTKDAIIFHNCLDNVLEYVSDRDSAVLMRRICREAPESFWGHVYNIGGGERCRFSTFELFSALFERIGIDDLSTAFDSKWFATRNFHGQYYLDSDKLEKMLPFRSDSMEYFYDIYLRRLGVLARVAAFIAKLPLGRRIIGSAIKSVFRAFTKTEHGTMHFIEANKEAHIAAFFGSRESWEKIPPLDRFEHFSDWDKVVPIDHGYDENKPENELGLEDVREAAVFRGGSCLSRLMTTGDWRTKLKFRCAFGHEFEASPRLVLEGGHWCPVCERESWNYQNTAKVNPFFAQVWYPLHDRDEEPRVYRKIVSELDAVSS